MRSERSALKSDTKLQERLQGSLKQLRKESGNAKCADCSDTDTRFVSISLGTFICNRCFGLHRALGTHLTKTRVINLDAWTQDEVEKLAAIGNTRANAYYLAKLPPHVRPPEPDTSDRMVERFLREKYEERRYCADGLPPWEQKISPRITNSSAADPGRTFSGVTGKASRNSAVSKDPPSLIDFQEDHWDPFGMGSQPIKGESKEPHTAIGWDTATTATLWPPHWPPETQGNVSTSPWPSPGPTPYFPMDKGSIQIDTPIGDRSRVSAQGFVKTTEPWPELGVMSQAVATTAVAHSNPWAKDLQQAASRNGYLATSQNYQVPPRQIQAANNLQAQGRQASWTSEFDPLWK